MNWKKLTRKTHYWASLFIAIPSAIVIGSGLILQMKKQSSWVQPPTARGSAKTPTLTFDEILKVAATVKEAEIESWSDVDRLDVRPGKGVVKVRANNRWEVQIDAKDAKVLHSQYRRSDLIESIHDGSFFHPLAKMWLFLPAGIALFIMWLTGIYLFLMPYLGRRKRGAPKTG